MNKSKKSKVISKLCLIIFVILGFCSVYFYITKGFSKMVTERVYLTKTAEKISANCIILKKEKVIDENYDGYLSYVLQDGSKVQKGGIVANVYNSQAQAVNLTEQERCKSEYENLSKLNSVIGGINVGVNTLDSQIKGELYKYIIDYKFENYDGLWEYRENLQYYLNEKKLMIGEVDNYDERIAELKSAIDDFPTDDRQVQDYIYAPESGYFSSVVDGYESIYGIENLEELTVKDYNKLLKADPKKNKNAVGKVLYDAGWYVVCPLSNSVLLNMGDISTVSLTFTKSGTVIDTAYVNKIIKGTDGDEGLLILRCDVFNSNVINLRNENVEITLNTYKGFSIPKSAIRTIDGFCETTDENGETKVNSAKIYGVYVFLGNELTFKYIDILFSDENYVTSKSTSDPDKSCYYKDDKGEKVYISYLKEFDIMVTKGADLYNGRVIK